MSLESKLCLLNSSVNICCITHATIPLRNDVASEESHRVHTHFRTLKSRLFHLPGSELILDMRE